MLDDLRELYQEVILDHGKRPRNFRRIDNANRQAHGNNPICGDMLIVYLAVDDGGVIQDLAFQGKGCAISMASASMMTEILKGRSVAEAEKLFHCFHEMCTKDDAKTCENADQDTLDRLSICKPKKIAPRPIGGFEAAHNRWQRQIEALGRIDAVSIHGVIEPRRTSSASEKFGKFRPRIVEEALHSEGLRLAHAAFVGGRPVNGRHRHVEFAEVDGKLTPMVDHVVHDECADHGNFRHGHESLVAHFQRPVLHERLVAAAGNRRTGGHDVFVEKCENFSP